MRTKKSGPDPFERYYRYSWLVVLVVPFLIYLSSLGLGYVYFDDDVLVLENQSQISDPANLGKFFTTDVFLGKTVPYYRPLLNMALMTGAQLSGTSPKGYHLVSILVHCLNCLVLLWFLGLVGFSKPKAFLGTIVFSLHPLIANAVFWIPALNDLLITLFALLSFASFISFVDRKSWPVFFLHLFSLTCAFFSKESAIALPFLFLFYFLLKKQRIPGVKKVILCVSWLGIILLWFLMRRGSVGLLEGGEQGVGAILKNLPFLPEIAARFILPFSQPVMPVFSLFYTVGGVLLFILLTILVLTTRQKTNTVILLGLAWFMAFALPNMFIRQFNTPDSFDYLEHRACLPSVGLLMILLGLLPEAWADMKQRKVRIVFALVLVFLGTFTLVQERKYRDGEAFWQSVLHDSPDRAWFHHFYGRYYFKQQNFEKFEDQLLQAVRLKDYGTFEYNLGMIELVQRKNFEAAYARFTRAIAMGETKPDVLKNFVNLCNESSVALSKNRQDTLASERVQMALNYDPGNIPALMNLALFSINLGNNAKAVSLWKHVTVLDPSVTSAWKNLAVYYAANTRFTDSASYFSSQFARYGGNPAEIAVTPR